MYDIDQMGMAQSDIDQMGIPWSGQAVIVKSIVRLRDMYRVILEQTGNALPNVSQAEKNYVCTKELILDLKHPV